MESATTSHWPGDSPADQAGDSQARAALRLLADHMASESAADLERPHVLVITEDGFTYVSGPYPDGFAALCALEDDRRANADVVAARGYRVTPLLTPFCPHIAARPRDDRD